MDLSFVIPAKNEERNIEVLYKELLANIPKHIKSYEIIFIDDGSTDKTYDQMLDLRKKNKKVKIIQHRGNWGKSTALQNGFNKSQGDIVITMDADLQDNPKEIQRFLKKIDEGYDLVSGWKKDRHDPIHFVVMSRILNYFLIPTFTGLKIHDTNCGFKAYKNDVVKSLNLYGELYRYIPIIVSKNNYRVGEIEVEHRSRKYGKTKYGMGKNFKGLLDLMTIVFLTGYLRRPAHFFGGLGLISFLCGFIIGLYITYLRITTGGIQYRQPLLFLGMLLMIIGVQLVSTGLIAEMIISISSKNKSERAIRRYIS